MEYPLDTFIVLEVFFFLVCGWFVGKVLNLAPVRERHARLTFISCVNSVFATGSVSFREWAGGKRSIVSAPGVLTQVGQLIRAPHRADLSEIILTTHWPGGPSFCTQATLTHMLSLAGGNWTVCRGCMPAPSRAHWDAPRLMWPRVFPPVLGITRARGWFQGASRASSQSIQICHWVCLICKCLHLLPVW